MMFFTKNSTPANYLDKITLQQQKFINFLHSLLHNGLNKGGIYCVM